MWRVLGEMGERWEKVGAQVCRRMQITGWGAFKVFDQDLGDGLDVRFAGFD